MSSLLDSLKHDLTKLQSIDAALELNYSSHGWEVITERPLVKDMEKLNANLYYALASASLGPVMDVTFRYNDVLVTFDDSHTKPFEVLSWETVTELWLKHREEADKGDDAKLWSRHVQCPAEYLAMDDAQEAWFRARRDAITDRIVCLTDWVALHECDCRDKALRAQRKDLAWVMEGKYKTIVEDYVMETIPVVGHIHELAFDFDSKNLTLSEQAYDVMYVIVWEEFIEWLKGKNSL